MNPKKQDKRKFEITKFQEQLDEGTLDFLNYILGNVFNVELQVYIYSERD